MALRTGKLPPKLLERSIRHTGAKDSRVVLGPRLGEDAAIVRAGEELLVLKTDPVTYASDMIGWYAVHVNANDIATRGARPSWFQATVLLPEGADDRLPESIARQISSACEELGVAVTGGHTEVTPGIKDPIVVGDMHGILGRRQKPVFTSGLAETSPLSTLPNPDPLEPSYPTPSSKCFSVKRPAGIVMCSHCPLMPVTLRSTMATS